jgi:hypothetical protein
MIYIEFTSRRPQAGVRLDSEGTLSVESFESQLQRFHRAVLEGQSGWADSFSKDEPILSIGRTWRLGPEPEYMTIWHTPGAGLERIDDWDTVFRSGEADELNKPFREVAWIEQAGCYEALLTPRPRSVAEPSAASERARGDVYYAEFFEPAGSRDAIRELYSRRAASHPGLVLALCVTRIGKLAPHPGGLAVWILPSYGQLGAVAQDLDGLAKPVRLTTVGVYNDVGKEIL